MSTQKKSKVSDETLENAMSYKDYRNLIDELLAENKTTGDNHSESYLHYTKMNVQRMKRLDKTIELSNELKGAVDHVDSKLYLLGLTEAWCGDAAQNLPVFHKLAEYSDNIELKLLLRDENLEIMDQYLTNGGRAIPKVVALDASNLGELWNWGPRPAAAQKMYMEAKEKQDFDYQETAKELHKWYAKDKTQTQQSELVTLFESMSD